MKILYVTHSFPPHHWRGTEIYTFELAREMKKSHEVRVLYMVDEDTGPKAELRKAEYQGIPLIQVVKRLKPWEPVDYFFDPVIGSLFRQVLDDYVPDLVHFTYFLGGFPVGLLAVARGAAKVVVTVTDFAAFCPRGQLLDQDFNACGGPRRALRCVRCLFDRDILFKNRRLDNVAREIFPAPLSGFINVPELRLLQRRLAAISRGLRKADHVIFSNRNTRNIFVYLGFRFMTTHVIDFGIDTGPYMNHKKTPADKLRLGYIGQILPHKGLRTLIGAVKGLDPAGFGLKLYGSLDDPGSREFFESMKIDAGRSVEHKGVFDFSMMNEVLQEIDVLVVPSIWQENCPLIVKYGLATRTRMILSNVPGMMAEEVNADGIYRFQAGDSSELGNVIARLIDTGDWKKPVESDGPLVTDIGAATMPGRRLAAESRLRPTPADAGPRRRSGPHRD